MILLLLLLFLISIPKHSFSDSINKYLRLFFVYFTLSVLFCLFYTVCFIWSVLYCLFYNKYVVYLL